MEIRSWFRPKHSTCRLIESEITINCPWLMRFSANTRRKACPGYPFFVDPGLRGPLKPQQWLGIDHDEQDCSVINVISVNTFITLGTEAPPKSPVGSLVGCRRTDKVTNLVGSWGGVASLDSFRFSFANKNRDKLCE